MSVPLVYPGVVCACGAALLALPAACRISLFQIDAVHAAGAAPECTRSCHRRPLQPSQAPVRSSLPGRPNVICRSIVRQPTRSPSSPHSQCIWSRYLAPCRYSARGTVLRSGTAFHGVRVLASWRSTDVAGSCRPIISSRTPPSRHGTVTFTFVQSASASQLQGPLRRQGAPTKCISATCLCRAAQPPATPQAPSLLPPPPQLKSPCNM